MDEEHPLNPRSPYAATKAGGDRLAYSYWVTYGLPIVIVRPFNNYGPRQHPEKVVPRFVTQALAGEPLTIHGDGHASRDWLHVDDTRVGDRGADRGAARRGRGRGRERRDGRRHLRHRDRPARARGRRRTRDATTVHVDERPGQVDRHIGSTDKLARAHGLARVDRLRGRARANGRLVSRERGLVARRPRARRASPRPRRRPGPARPARGRAGARRPGRDRGRPRPAGARLRPRRRARRALVGGRGGDRPPRARPRRRRASSRPGADWPVGIAARVAERIGLPHPIDARTASLATSKARQREALRRGRRPARAGVRPARPRAPVPLRREGARPAGPARAHARARRRRSSTRRSRRRPPSRAAAALLVEEHVDGPGGDGQRGLASRAASSRSP